MSDRREELRRRVVAETEDESLRELAARIGVSHNSLWKLLHGEGMRPSTLRRIREGLDAPGAEAAVQDLRRSIKRLVGRLGKGRVKQVERELGMALAKAFERAGEEVPRAVKGLVSRGMR